MRISQAPICSFGVKLGYSAAKLDDVDDSGAGKIAPVAEKNEAVWYMGTDGR